MTYDVRLNEAADRDLGRLSAAVRAQVIARIAALADDPRPPDSRALSGELRGSRRLRSGDYRISYTVDHHARIIEVWAIAHRSRFYAVAARRRR